MSMRASAFPLSPREDDTELLEAATRLRGAVAKVSRRSRRVATGLTEGEAATLATIVRKGPLRAGALALHEGLSDPALSRLIAQLERSGLVERLDHGGDRRTVVVAATVLGAETNQAVKAQSARRLADAMADLAPDALDALARALPVLEDLAEALNPRALAAQTQRAEKP